MSFELEFPRFCQLLCRLLVFASLTTSAFAHPGSGIVVERRGYVYFVDTASGVWVIDPGGKLARHGGSAFHWMALDQSGRPSDARRPHIPAGEIEALGTNPTLLLSSDVPIAVSEDGALYYPEWRDERLRIKRFTRAGVETLHANLPPGRPRRWINGLTAGAAGSLYYTEDDTVRKIDEQGRVSTFAEKVQVPDCTRIPGIEKETGPYLRGVAVAPDGAVFVAASGCGAVLKITPRGQVTAVLRTQSPWSPTAVATSPSGLYVLEYLHTATEDRPAWVPRVRKVLPDGSIVNIAAVERPKAR